MIKYDPVNLGEYTNDEERYESGDLQRIIKELYDQIYILLKNNAFVVLVIMFLLGFAGYKAVESIGSQEDAGISGLGNQNNLENRVPLATQLSDETVEEGLGIDGTSMLYIDISGAVENPGLYKLPTGSKLADALKVGGPISSESSTAWFAKNINLASDLKDGQKIYIPFEWEISDKELVFSISDSTSDYDKDSKNSSSPADAFEPANQGISENDGAVEGDSINVNNASVSELKSLSGIGNVYAQKIIDNRSYSDFDELVSKTKIPRSTLEKLKDQLSY